MRRTGQKRIQRNVAQAVGRLRRRATVVQCAAGVVPAGVEIEDAVVQRASLRAPTGIAGHGAIVQGAIICAIAEVAVHGAWARC